MGREKFRRPILSNKALTAAYTRSLGLALTDLRVFDALKSFLPDVPGTDDLGLAVAAGSAVVSTAANNTSVTQKLGADIVLPPDYKAGGAVSVRISAKLGGAIAVTKTLGVVAKKIAAGALGSDICATAAQVLAVDNALANYDFVLTPTTIAPGSRVNLVVTVILDDTAGTANKLATIAELTILYEGTEGGQ